jgi:hypothetical protein
MFYDKMLFKWYQAPIVADILTRGFEKNGFKVVFAESEIVRQDFPLMLLRKSNIREVDFEARNTKIFFGCEIKVGWSRNKKIKDSDSHVIQFLEEAEIINNKASDLKIEPHYSIALGSEISEELMNEIQSICKNFSVLIFRPNVENETSFPVITKILGSNIDYKLINSINDISKNRWNNYQNWNNFIIEIADEAKTPREVFNSFTKNILNRNPEEVKWQNLFSSQFRHNKW